MISEKGRQYAMYMHHSHTNFGKFRGSYYEPAYGEYEPVLSLKMEKGEYTVTFLEPESLKVLKVTDISSSDEETHIMCPRYTLDIAIRIIAKA